MHDDDLASLRSVGGRDREPRNELTLLATLSKREIEVLVEIANGKKSQEIARQLGLAPKTVETHRHKLMNKLKLHDRVLLTRFAIRSGLIDP